MKNIFALFLLLSGLNTTAQKVSGFYSGTLVNDSNKMVQQYELALSEYRGKITGYSYVTFVSNDTFYYGIRSITAKIEDQKLVVMDDDFIAHNFPEAPAKGVKRLFVFPLEGQDSIISLKGNWQTNRTKKYYSIPGNATLAKSNDSSKSALFRHLNEMDMVKTVAVKEEKKNKEPKTVAATGEKEQKPQIIKPPVSLSYDQRAKKQVSVFETTSDSLLLSFYDNGVIDGDSISVYVNGSNIISNIKLAATATRKSIKLDGNEIEILLVAENLGTIPPNTGLVVINDGTKIYQLHFSADLQNNA